MKQLKYWKFIESDDADFVKEMRAALDDNLGFCPCKTQKIHDNKCMCREFRDAPYETECHCGLYRKVLIQ